MYSFASIFEIPATSLERAVKFYSGIFSALIEIMDIPGVRMGLFPYEGQSTIGVIIEGEGYFPSSSGSCSSIFEIFINERTK